MTWVWLRAVVWRLLALVAFVCVCVLCVCDKRVRACMTVCAVRHASPKVRVRIVHISGCDSLQCLAEAR